MLPTKSIWQITAILAALSCSCCTVIKAQLHTADSTAPVKRIYTAQYLLKPPVIDGKLDDSCWNEGEWQTDYKQFSPVYKGSSSKKTALKVLYSTKSVFVAIRAYDDMKAITRRLGRRDNYLGDIVGVMFDSYFDHRTAFEFDMTAAGQKIDVWVSNDGWDVNWNAVWDGKVAYEANAWTAEMEIPLSQLRYAAGATIWGFNSWRRTDRLQEENHWNLVANDGTGLVYTFGELHGLKKLSKNRRLELVPYVSGKLTADKTVQGNPFAKGLKFNPQAGLDAKIGITNNFTLDATINPDFGQVEADPSVMNITAFESYFDEKRPFFTEGKNIFDFTFDGDQLFYSRRIGHTPSYTPAFDTVQVPEFTAIGGAFKLSGKTSKGLSLGIIESFTPKTMAAVFHNGTRTKQTAEPFSNYFIARFQKDYNKGNTIIGGIVTHTSRQVKDDQLRFLPVNAVTGGLEMTHYWNNRKFYTELKLTGSTVNGDIAAISRLQLSSARYFQRPGIKGLAYDSARTKLEGTGIAFKIGKWSKGHWRYDAAVIMRSQGLELNDLGYMNQAGMIKNNNMVSYNEKKNTRIFKTYTVSLLQQNAWDARGEKLFSGITITAQTELMSSWTAQLTVQHKWDITDEWLLRGGPAMKMPALLEYNWQLQTNASKKLYFGLKGDYYRGASKSLQTLNLSAEASYRPLSRLLLLLQPSWLHSKNELQYIGAVTHAAGGQKYLLAKLYNRNLGIAFRIDYAVNPALTIQYYASPFIAAGRYLSFKEVAAPSDNIYTHRFFTIKQQAAANTYLFDDNNDGISDFTIDNPDFNYQQFRSNLVLRWEYKPGSSLYMVWSQNRTNFEQPGLYGLNEGLSHLFAIYPRNVFMIKLSCLFRK